MRPIALAATLPVAYRPAIGEPSCRSTRACSSARNPPQVPRSPGTTMTAWNGASSSGARHGFGVTRGSP